MIQGEPAAAFFATAAGEVEVRVDGRLRRTQRRGGAGAEERLGSDRAAADSARAV